MTNYHIVAIQMLEQEFLDKEFIIDETFKNILKACPSYAYDHEYSSTKSCLNEIRSYLFELKRQRTDLLQEDTGGHSLISHIIFNKLPAAVKKEFIHLLSKIIHRLQKYLITITKYIPL